MKSRWKRVFVWSSLGSLAVGVAVALARKPRIPQTPKLESQKIPSDCQRVSIWTEQFHERKDRADLAIQDKYVLQVTPFKVWSVLELGDTIASEKLKGATVYHVAWLRYAGAAPGEGYPDEGRLQDRFYGTVATLNLTGKRSPKDHFARGGILEIRKCLVGGASNGVETGEVHHAAAPVLNYRFEYSAR
jgi:hypothetical protein